MGRQVTGVWTGPTAAGVDQGPAASSLPTPLICGTLGSGPRGVTLLPPQTPEESGTWWASCLAPGPGAAGQCLVARCTGLVPRSALGPATRICYSGSVRPWGAARRPLPQRALGTVGGVLCAGPNIAQCGQSSWTWPCGWGRVRQAAVVKPQASVSPGGPGPGSWTQRTARLGPRPTPQLWGPGAPPPGTQPCLPREADDSQRAGRQRPLSVSGHRPVPAALRLPTRPSFPGGRGALLSHTVGTGGPSCTVL